MREKKENTGEGGRGGSGGEEKARGGIGLGRSVVRGASVEQWGVYSVSMAHTGQGTER